MVKIEVLGFGLLFSSRAQQGIGRKLADVLS
jgi:hypothetical protein